MTCLLVKLSRFVAERPLRYRKYHSESKIEVPDVGKPRFATFGGYAGLCAPGTIRTYDLRFRRPTLYPAELRAPAGGAI